MRLYILLLLTVYINTNIYSQIKPKITTNQISNLLVDSTRLENDSILVYYQNGIIIGRDTISGTGGSVGGVTGSGTTNYLPKFTDATTLGNSMVYESGDTLVVPKFLNVDTATFFVNADSNRVGIGTSTPNRTLEINLDIGGTSNVFFIEKNTGANQHAFGGINNSVNGYKFSADTLQTNLIIDVFGSKLNLDDVGRGSDYQLIAVSNVDNGTIYKKGALQISNVYNDGDGYNYYSIGSNSIPNARLGIGVTDAQYQIHTQKGGYLNDSGQWIDASDVKYKENISDIDYGLKELMMLQPRKYRHIESQKNHIGFVAQEVWSVIPEVVENKTEYWGLSYGNLTALITKAIQEQQAIIESEAKEIETLKTQIQLILNEIQILKNN